MITRSTHLDLSTVAGNYGLIYTLTLAWQCAITLSNARQFYPSSPGGECYHIHCHSSPTGFVTLVGAHNIVIWFVLLCKCSY